MNNKFDKLVPGSQNKLHLAVDAGLATAGVFGAVRYGPDHLAWHTVSLALVVNVVWVLAAAVTRLYSPPTPRRTADNLMLRLFGAAMATAGLAGAAALLPVKGQAVDLASFIAFFYTATGFARLLVFRPLARFARPGQDVLVVGTGHLAAATYQRLVSAQPDQRSHVVGFLSLAGQPAQMPAGIAAPVLGSADALLAVLAAHPVTEVYLAARVTEHAGELQALVAALEDVGMPFALPLHSLAFERAQLLSSSPARDGYLHYMSTAWKPVQYAMKRLVDIVASAAALVVLAPLLLVTAAAIKITAPGPVFFKQKRVGLHGATFDLLKFRSMVVDAEALKERLMATNEQSGPVFKMQNDPRITGVGHFIRRYSVDELPQLINILRGDMTIVGPRPALPKEVAAYKAWQRRRLSVRPGLTCYWQVSGRNSIGFEEWMKLDLRYVDEWHFGLDVRLILQTFPAVLAGRGAS